MTKINYMEETIKIKRNWNNLICRVAYAQLLERLVEIHGLDLDEAIDILYIANYESREEALLEKQNEE